MGRLNEVAKRLERSAKAVLRSSVVQLLPKPRPPAAPVDQAAVRRILAVRPDARLGNLLMLTPSLRLIRMAFPSARVEVLVAARYADVLKHNDCVDAILTLKDLPGLRARHYDLAFDFSPQHAFSLSSAFCTAISNARRRIGFDRGDAAKFLDDVVPVPAAHAHETANLARLVRHAAPNAVLSADKDLRTEWHFGPGESEAGALLWRSWGLDAQSVGLFLGARAEKRLAPQWFLELAGHLRGDGHRVVLLAGPAESALIKGLALPEGVCLAPKLPLRPFAAAISHARACLSADTGPMHLCVALGVPTVEIFSHTEAWRFGYAHVGHRVFDADGRHPSVHEAWSVLSDLIKQQP